MSFAGEVTADFLVDEAGYAACRQLPGGGWLAVAPQLYTTGLFVIEDRLGYKCRYCYQRGVHALLAMQTWDGEGDPPGPWVKHKGNGFDRLNPALADENAEFC